MQSAAYRAEVRRQLVMGFEAGFRRGLLDYPGIVGYDSFCPIVLHVQTFPPTCSLCTQSTAGVLRDGTTLCEKHLNEQGYGVIVCRPYIEEPIVITVDPST